MCYPAFTFMELGAPVPAEEMEKALGQREAIFYRSNGPRASSPESTLKRILPLAAKIGITRVAEISQLSPFPFPVFQSTRPNLYGHTGTGQNSGSQGKGFTKTQAQVSCIMESLEAYCSEPRGARLVRGSYSYLRNHHVVARPGMFERVRGASVPRDTEPLMWTPALALGKNVETLIPAEAVYFPFFPKDYETRSLFPQSGNGTSAGNTYVEAAVHSLYEAIERHYTSLWEAGRARAEALYEEEASTPSIEAFRRSMGGEFELQLYAISAPRLPDLAMIMCYVVGEFQTFAGYGCASNVETAVDRASAEAFQSMTTIYSASRESLVYDQGFIRSKTKHVRSRLPERRTLHVKELNARLSAPRFRRIDDELAFLQGWTRGAGFRNVFLADLSRVGLDVPVVKAVIPGMTVILEARLSPSRWTSDETRRKQFVIT